MPRLLLVLALALALALPLVAAEPAIPGTIHAVGKVSWFDFGRGAEGFPFSGGAYDWTRICADCTIRVTIVDGTWAVYDPATGSALLAPGLYELRELRGIVTGNDVAPHDFDLEVHGLATVSRLG